MQKYTPWTTEELEILKILRLEQRLPYKEIAKTLGRSEKSCHSSIRRHSKEEFEENLRLRKELNKKILNLWMSGLGKREISERLNVKFSSILNLLSYVANTACLDKKIGKIKNKFKRWTVEEDRIIVKSQPIEIKTLSKKLKRTSRGVLARIYELRKKRDRYRIKKARDKQKVCRRLLYKEWRINAKNKSHRTFCRSRKSGDGFTEYWNRL